MAFCIMCCTCRHLMDRNGGLTESTLEEILSSHGYVNYGTVSVISGTFIPPSMPPTNLADYATKELADAACLRYGWTTRTPSGIPDHTCPGCQTKKTAPEPRPRHHGAYIDAATLRIIE